MSILNSDYLVSSLHNPLVRHWSCEGSTEFDSRQFIQPYFVVNESNAIEKIESMPGVSRFGTEALIAHLDKLINVEKLPLQSILLFPVLNEKPDQVTNCGTAGVNPVIRIANRLKKLFPELCLIADTCLCGFTESGHCCVNNDSGSIDNKATLDLISNLALSYAQSGIDIIAPSCVQDNAITAVKAKLRDNNFAHIAVMSYAAKFASKLYGPFREAAKNCPSFGDRAAYQFPPGSAAIAVRAVERDIRQGADIVMVKPGLPYLDIIYRIKQAHPHLPLAVYHVSGEYSWIKCTSNGDQNCIDLVVEMMACFKRAGASIIITYFTEDILRWLKQKS